MQIIDNLEERLKELRGDEFAENDEDFQYFLSKKNRKQIKQVEKMLKECEADKLQLTREEKREATISNLNENILFTIHEAGGWRTEVRLPLTSIGHFYLQRYCYTLGCRNLAALDIMTSMCDCQLLFRERETQSLPMFNTVSECSHEKKSVFSSRTCWEKLRYMPQRDSKWLAYLEELVILSLAQYKSCLVLPRVQALDFVSPSRNPHEFCAKFLLSGKDIITLLKEDICWWKKNNNYLNVSRSTRLVITFLANCDWGNVSCADFEELFTEFKQLKPCGRAEIVGLLKLQTFQLPKFSGLMSQACCLETALQKLLNPNQPNHSSQELRFCQYRFKTVIVNSLPAQSYESQYANFTEVIKSKYESAKLEEISEVKWKSDLIVPVLEEQMMLDDLLAFSTLPPEKLQRLLTQEGGVLRLLNKSKLITLQIAQQKATVFEKKEQVHRVLKLLAMATQRARDALINVTAIEGYNVQGENEKRLLQEAKLLGENALAEVEALKFKSATWSEERTSSSE